MGLSEDGRIKHINQPFNSKFGFCGFFLLVEIVERTAIFVEEMAFCDLPYADTIGNGYEPAVQNLFS